MNYYKHATTELQAALQRLVHMPSHMYVHSHSPLSRGSTSRTDVPGGVRVSRAERAKPLQDDLTTTRNHTPKPTLGISMPARAAPFARTGAEALDVSAGSAAYETKVHYGYGYLTCTLQLRGKDLPAKAALGSDSRARTRAAGRALVARGRDRARSASQLTEGAASRCCTRCQLAHSRVL